MAGLAGGMNAQCAWPAARPGFSPGCAFAPWSIQVSMQLDLGLRQRRPVERHPIARPVALRASISGLSAPLPGKTTGPPLPPASAAAAVSRRSPPRGLAAPWQLTQ